MAVGDTASAMLAVVLWGVVGATVHPPHAWAQAQAQAQAQPSHAAVAAPAASEEKPSGLVAPRALSAQIASPPEAASLDTPIEVTVIIRVDELGEVSEVRLSGPCGVLAIDQAVLLGATRFRFEPAQYDGVAVAVDITFTQRFEKSVPALQAESPAPAQTEAPPQALLAGRVMERGTNRPVEGAFVTIVDSEKDRSVTTSDAGVFVLPLDAATVQVRVMAPGFQVFLQEEMVAAGEQIEVRYLLDRSSDNPYETVVRTRGARQEVARTTLSDREIKHVPGTFGDPFRVVTVLPGVSSMMGLLPLPVVRGSSPGNTGFFLDGERLPMLFHFLGGPAVVHPEFIDRVDFYAGGFGVQYGGYTAGIADGKTRPARADERRYDIDFGLAQTGVLIRQGLGGNRGALTVAGRYGYPGLLMRLASSEVTLSYWDYQLRYDHGDRSNGLTLFALGASDHIKENVEGVHQTALLFSFHRLDSELRRRFGKAQTSFRLVIGTESTTAAADSFSTRARMIAPRMRVRAPLSSTLRLDAGIEGRIKPVRLTVTHEDDDDDEDPADEEPGNPAQFSLDTGRLYAGSAFLELQWKPQQDALLITPGLRVDLFSHGGTHVAGFDPRLLMRYRLAGDAAQANETWLKGAIGVYHQPARFFIPIPGLAESLLENGLLRATHWVVGLEREIANGIELDVQAYFNDMNPVFMDAPGIDSAEFDPATPGPSSPPGAGMPDDSPVGANADVGTLADGFDAYLNEKIHGRSYGVEVLLRHRVSSRLYGWVAYTLSRSMRQKDGEWIPFDYDRTHIFNGVAGLILPRNWEFSARVLYQTGTPLTTIHGRNAGRAHAQFRLDIRFDKRAIWNDWILDFYVDITNASVSPESGGVIGGESFRYLVPTLGFRGVLM